MNKHVKDASRKDTATARTATGHESAIPELRHLAQVAWHEPVVTVLLLIAAFTAITGRLVNGVPSGLAAAALAWGWRTQADQERRPSSAGAAVEPARRRRSLLRVAGWPSAASSTWP